MSIKITPGLRLQLLSLQAMGGFGFGICFFVVVVVVVFSCLGFFLTSFVCIFTKLE